MPLTPGTQLGPYVILGPLGRGGMGEVYRANDSRLGREVAVKVLPAHTAADAEHRARLEREARAVAALSHAHICTLYDVGRSGDTDYLVMELVQGETLEARLARGPLPLVELLERGAEIAEALQVAHRAGVLHRDLKPSNVMLTRGGAKLMDFGLARSTPRDFVAIGQTQASTGSVPITGEGRIVGTVQYMAPEQLEGRAADTRSDLWALGVTLYEMATAHRPFEGASSASVIGAILRDEPTPLTERAPLTPPALDRLVRRCLAKDPEARWQSAGDLAYDIRAIAQHSPVGGAPPGPYAVELDWGARLRAGFLGALLAIVATGVLLALLGRAPWQASARAEVVRTQVALPAMGNSGVRREYCALSPDGKAIAITIPDSSGTRRLFIRSLDLSDVAPLGGAPEASSVFWSPDSRQVAFVTSEHRLVKMSMRGEAPQTICKVADFESGAWGKHRCILFSTGAGPIMRVSESGGVPEPVTKLDPARHETTHGFPMFLPDGRHFAYLTDPPLGPSSFRVRVACIDNRSSWDLMTVQHAPRCDGHGWLVFMRDRGLLAQRVDPAGRKLVGDPVPMREVPERQGGGEDPIVDVADETLIYCAEDARPIGLNWYTRQGVPAGHLMEAGSHSVAPEVSRDGRHAVLRRVQGGETWLTSIDLMLGGEHRLTSPERWNSWPIWDASGSEILFSSNGSGSYLGGPFEIRAMDPDDPNSNHLLTASPQFLSPDACSQDGRLLLVTREYPGKGSDLYLVDRTHGWEERPLVATAANEPCGVIVGDGTKLAFVSDVSGREELYLDDFPVRHKAVRLTSEGCGFSFFNRHHVWAVADDLLYFGLDARTLHSIHLKRSGGNWLPGEDSILFTLPAEYRGWCPAPDGSRFLVLLPSERSADPMLTVVQHWQHGLATR